MKRRSSSRRGNFWCVVNMNVHTGPRRKIQMARIRRCKRYELLKGPEMSKKHEARKQYSRKRLISCFMSFSSLVDRLLSYDNDFLLKATIEICELLTEQKPHGHIQLKLVSQFVKLLKEDFPPLQCEAAWALANIGSDSETSEGAKVVMELALPTFVDLLSSTNADVREQAVFALGIIAGRSPTFRDCVLGYDALGPLLELLKEDPKLSMLRNATWTLSNLCGGIPKPSFEKVRPALDAMKSLLCSNDREVLSNSCLALSYLSNGNFDQIEEVIRAGVCPRLVQLLYCSSPSVVISALHAIGYIVSGIPSQVKVILDLGALPHLLSLLTDKVNNKFIKNRACFVISNITAGKNEIQAVIEAGLIEPLVELLKTADVNACVRGVDVDTCVLAALAISNAAYFASCEQIKCLASKGCIEPLCNLVVHSSDPSILCTCLVGLGYIMENGGTRVYPESIKAAVGLERFLDLAHDENEKVARAARSSLWDVSFAPQGDGYL